MKKLVCIYLKLSELKELQEYSKLSGNLQATVNGIIESILKDTSKVNALEENEEMERLVVRIDEKNWQKFKALCDKKKISYSRAIGSYLKD